MHLGCFNTLLFLLAHEIYVVLYLCIFFLKVTNVEVYFNMLSGLGSFLSDQLPTAIHVIPTNHI